MINTELLSILRCPETRQKVAPASAELITQLNDRVAAGQLRSRNDQTVTERLDGGLLREDGKWLYPVRQNIPVMLIDEAIAVG
ncbi:MAG TPA: hypothetical protein VHH73_14090 [Verrucomicrobiae bacterium]|nr:hypothetical protein [Verrucomicrobiae bacterium]